MRMGSVSECAGLTRKRSGRFRGHPCRNSFQFSYCRPERASSRLAVLLRSSDRFQEELGPGLQDHVEGRFRGAPKTAEASGARDVGQPFFASLSPQSCSHLLGK